MKKVPILSLVNATFVCTTVLSTLCIVLCFKNEGDHPHFSPLNLKENDPSLWQPINDRAALKELYELYNVDPIWKRAPASGFYGVRGKKVPSNNFFGMRGKKGPSGFLGMRGKKTSGIQEDFDGEPLDAELSDLWTSKELPHGMDNGKQLQQQQLLMGDMDDHTDAKRVPADGFMGLRGKRNLKNSVVLNQKAAAVH